MYRYGPTIVSLSCRTLLAYVTRMRRMRKIGEDVSCTARTAQANDFELILTVKAEIYTSCIEVVNFFRRSVIIA